MLLHMMWASVLRNGLCNSYSGIYLVLQLLTTISVTILHTTKNKAARTYCYSCCQQQHLLLAFILRRKSCKGRSILHWLPGGDSVWKYHGLFQEMGQLYFTVAPCTATSDRTPCLSEPYVLQDYWCTLCIIKGAVFKRPHVSASSYVALTEPLVARDKKSTNVDCLVLEQQSRRLPYALYALFVSSINAKINVNPLMWLLFKHPFGLTFLSSPSSLRGVRQKLNFQLLPAFPSCLTDCVYQ